MNDLSYSKAYKDLVAALGELYPAGEAAAISRQVLEEITGLTLTTLRLQTEQTFDLEQEQEFQRIRQALLKQEPIQYILGYVDFYGFRLKVNRDVLIPRPETEELADWIIKEQSGSQQIPTTMLDIGTGSGCLAIALKTAFPDSTVFAADDSLPALEITRENAENGKLDITLLVLDILKEQSAELLPELDLVVSNPPYITVEEAGAMALNVLNYEPHSALFVSNADPLQFYKAIETFCRPRLKPGGSIYLELNAVYANAVRKYYERQGWKTELRQDFQEKARMLKVSRRD